MKITPEGQRYVATLEFALALRECLAECCYEENMSEKLGTAYIVVMVGWVLTGGDIDYPPQSPDELLELKTFVESHMEEINAAVGKCLEATAKHDCGNTIH